MRLECVKCRVFVGEINSGKIHKRAILLCERCWGVADAAMRMAEMDLPSGRAAAGDAEDFGKTFMDFLHGASSKKPGGQT
jgi:hypothetical protein